MEEEIKYKQRAKRYRRIPVWPEARPLVHLSVECALASSAIGERGWRESEQERKRRRETKITCETEEKYKGIPSTQKGIPSTRNSLRRGIPYSEEFPREILQEFFLSYAKLRLLHEIFFFFLKNFLTNFSWHFWIVFYFVECSRWLHFENCSKKFRWKLVQKIVEKFMGNHRKCITKFMGKWWENSCQIMENLCKNSWKKSWKIVWEIIEN